MAHLKKLQWQCRRGTKELDLLLQRYLASGYLQADAQEQALFAELLQFEDDVLVGFLLGELDVGAGKMKLLLEKIRAFAVDRV